MKEKKNAVNATENNSVKSVENSKTRKSNMFISVDGFIGFNNLDVAEYNNEWSK